VVAANKYTGAAAVAEHCCRALRAAGVDAGLLFTAGRNLERRLQNEPWARAGLVKERTPAALARNVEAVRDLAAECDTVICHLPHDHVLAVAARVHHRAALIRSFRNPRHLRSDPLHRALTRRLDGCLLANAAMVDRLDTLCGAIPNLALPVPVEERFAPAAANGVWRRRLRIPEHAPVLGMVGKLATGRGFDVLLATASLVQPPVHVLAVGHGEARPALDRLAGRLRLNGRLHWAGYQEAALPELLAEMQVVLFAAPGSDHGHRAISEAQACGRVVVAAPLPGVEDLIRNGETGVIADGRPGALATAVSEVLRDPLRARRIGETAARDAAERRLIPSGDRLRTFLDDVSAGRFATRSA